MSRVYNVALTWHNLVLRLVSRFGRIAERNGDISNASIAYLPDVRPLRPRSGECTMECMVQDIRWIQRFANFTKALEQLNDAVTLAKRRSLSRLEMQGLIQAFEFTHELAWTTMKDFLEAHGVQNLYGSRDVARAAFKAGLIENGEVWMDMIQSRDLTSHTYDEVTAEKITTHIRNTYASAIESLKTTLDGLREQEQA